jgi:hypothetical protein
VDRELLSAMRKPTRDSATFFPLQSSNKLNASGVGLFPCRSEIDIHQGTGRKNPRLVGRNRKTIHYDQARLSTIEHD